MAYFLNALYTMFDSVTDKYNIFKVVSSNFDSNQPTYDIVLFDLQVDKVNDTHMIASGVPEKNGDKHAPGSFLVSQRLLSLSLSLDLGISEIAFTFTSLYLGFSEIATMALDLLNTSSGLRTPDRNRPTDRIQVQFSYVPV